MPDQPEKKTPFWERGGAEETSYLKEMVSHPASVYGGLAALAAGAILSIPLGLGFAAIPVLIYAAGEGIASLFVPSSPVFREAVNRRKRAERRSAMRQHLEEEITKRVGADHRLWGTVKRMDERLRSLEGIAKNSSTTLSLRETERMAEVVVNFLGLWLARLIIAERLESMDDRRLAGRIQYIDQQIAGAATPVDRKRLERAREDLTRVAGRRDSLRARETALDAAMLAMADAFEEVYQQIITDPSATDVTRSLEEAVSRMGVQQELEMAVDDELADLLPGRRAAAAASARKVGA